MVNTVNEMHDKFMKEVGAKVLAAKNDIINSGKRSERGYQFSAERIITSAENLFFQMGGPNSKYNDPVKAIYQGFSEKPGLNNVGNIAGVDVVDVNIQATQQSILGYICAERGLDKPVDTLWFQGLKAINNGKFKKNGWVNRPYQPMDKAIREAIKGTMVEVKKGTDGKYTLPTEAILDTMLITRDNKVVGKYVNGEIYFNDGATKATIENGVISVDGTDVEIKVSLDRTQERDGAHTLKVKPATETIQVTAQPRRIHLEQSYEDLKFQPKKAKSSYKINYVNSVKLPTSIR